MKIVFATNNINKLKEVQNQIGTEIELVTLQEIGCEEDIPETAETIEGNSNLKAAYIWGKYQLSCFADDTGLMIDALNGEPGVYSARYAGQHKSSDDNMDLVLQKLDGVSNRSAFFQTSITLILNGEITVFDGFAHGEITLEKSGIEGFGYDPIFKPSGYDLTFSEMEIEEKNAISHRGKAVGKLVDFLNSQA